MFSEFRLHPKKLWHFYAKCVKILDHFNYYALGAYLFIYNSVILLTHSIISKLKSTQRNGSIVLHVWYIKKHQTCSSIFVVCSSTISSNKTYMLNGHRNEAIDGPKKHCKLIKMIRIVFHIHICSHYFSVWICSWFGNHQPNNGFTRHVR